MRRFTVFAFCLLFAHFTMWQSAPNAITNSDVISMTKAGIGEQTIILAIQRGPVKFDTSPQALITLKGAGVSDQVLNAMLSGTRGGNLEGNSSPTFKSSEIIDPSERMAFENAVALTDPVAKSGNLEAFLQVYPQSVAKPAVLQMLAEIKRQAATNTPPPQTPNPISIQRAPETTTQGLTLRVLQEQSIPYTKESRGGISTTCNIVGTANTSAYVSTYGNSAYGSATTDLNQRMDCNSYDTTIRWPHVLNVMFAQASDGISYIIACDRAWRWSKCVPLRAGETFSGRFTGKGIEIQAVDSKGKEESPTYQILQSKAWR